MKNGMAALLASAPLLSGCLHLCYLTQAAAGQDDIAFRSRPLEEVVADPSVTVRTRELLSTIEDVKAFSEHHGLTRTDNYREYADLRREACVWVVVASEPLRFDPVTWRFPVVGTVPYLGWFHPRDAEALARSLDEEGYDVHTRHARAYSTLGWFRDPVLSTMLHDGGADVIDVVIHESVHATHYLASQALFNESLANFVAERLTLIYLRDRLRVDPWRLYDHRERQLRHDHRVRRMHDTYLVLAKVYDSKLADGDKLAAKKRILGELQRELGLELELNNAVLAQAQTYNSGALAFARLLDACGGAWPRFLAAVRRIGPNDFARPDQRDIDAIIRARADAGC
jgi:predicted aminopeptidase